MFTLVIQRRQYWFWIASLLALKLVLIFSVITLPGMFTFYRYVDTAIFIIVAVAVGARFVDIGWPRWLGYLSIFILMGVVPVVLLFAVYGLKPPRSEQPFDIVPDVQWIGTFATLAFLVFTGLKKSHPDSESHIKGPPSVDDRIEPRIM